MNNLAVNFPWLSNWVNRAVSAYDEYQRPNFIGHNGELKSGIYLGVPNAVYQDLDAVSSSKIKAFIESPAHYYREFVSGITRERSISQQRTLDTGSLSHELILEPCGFNDRYYRGIVPSDYPDALFTKEDIAKELAKYGISKSGRKQDLIRRLMLHAPQIPVFEEIERKHSESNNNKVHVDGLVWDDAHRVKNTVRSHNEANAYLQDGMAEVTILSRCQITGLMLKCKIDWLRFDDEAVDLKTARSTKPERFKRQAEELGYPIQQEFYKLVAELMGINISQFTFIAVEYANADICQPYKLLQDTADRTRRQIIKALREFKDCIESQHWYGWSKQDCTMELI